MRKIKGLLIDVKTDPGMVVEKELDDDILESYYDVLQCNVMDIVVRNIDGTPYNIVCDDEGLFDEKPIVSAVDQNYQPMLVGNLFVCNDDGEGRLTSLTEEDLQKILPHIIIRASRLGEAIHFAPCLMLD